jgi:four helix bundle protein
MSFKFEKLDVWNLSLELSDLVYELADKLPSEERFNLASQIIRAATSISLNIAEGSTSMSDKEQARFIGYAIRSLTEVVACIRLIERRGYIKETSIIDDLNEKLNFLFKKLQRFKQYLNQN